MYSNKDFFWGRNSNTIIRSAPKISLILSSDDKREGDNTIVRNLSPSDAWLWIPHCCFTVQSHIITLCYSLVTRCVCYFWRNWKKGNTEFTQVKGIYRHKRHLMLMMLAWAVRLESGSESCFKTEVGSLRVADRILPSNLTSFHHLYGVQSLRCSTLDS